MVRPISVTVPKNTIAKEEFRSREREERQPPHYITADPLQLFANSFLCNSFTLSSHKTTESCYLVKFVLYTILRKIKLHTTLPCCLHTEGLLWASSAHEDVASLPTAAHEVSVATVCT